MNWLDNDYSFPSVGDDDPQSAMTPEDFDHIDRLDEAEDDFWNRGPAQWEDRYDEPEGI